VSVPRGRVSALVGPNGAGKTTLLKILAGLSAPSAGEAAVLGRAPGQNAEFLDSVGYLAQDVPLYKRLSAGDHLEIGVHLNRHWDAAAARARLAALKIPLGRPVATLSGGQRAQVGLSLALAKRPRLLLLDEPVAALDPLARREFLTSHHPGPRRARRPAVPARQPGIPDRAARHRPGRHAALRHRRARRHQPGRHPRRPRRPGQARPRAMGHRVPALAPRHPLPRRPAPGPHPLRAPGHGRTQKPRHRPPAPGRTARHHRRHPLGQPLHGPALRHPRTHIVILKRPCAAAPARPAMFRPHTQGTKGRCRPETQQVIANDHRPFPAAFAPHGRGRPW
jgi:ABC-type transport system involved in cytochrome c biogenesis ATPase subunit